MDVQYIRYVMFIIVSSYALLGSGFNFVVPVLMSSYLVPNKPLLVLSLVTLTWFLFGIYILVQNILFCSIYYYINNQQEFNLFISRADKVYKIRDNPVFITNIYNGIIVWMDFMVWTRIKINNMFKICKIYDYYKKADNAVMNYLFNTNIAGVGHYISESNKFKDDLDKYNKVIDELDELIDDKKLNDMQKDISRMESTIIQAFNEFNRMATTNSINTIGTVEKNE